MISKYLPNPLIRFLVLAFSMYVLWYIIYEFIVRHNTSIDRYVIDNLIGISAVALSLLGYDLIPEAPREELIRTIGIDGTNGLWVGDPRNGLTLFALFAVFVLAFPGPWKTKAWFIPVGIIAIHFINALRIVALCIIVEKAPEYLEFNHVYVFQNLVYAFIFFLWWMWVKKHSGFSVSKISADEPKVDK